MIDFILFFLLLFSFLLFSFLFLLYLGLEFSIISWLQLSYEKKKCHVSHMLHVTVTVTVTMEECRKF